MPWLSNINNPGDGSLHFLPGLLERFAIMELDVLIVLCIFALAAVFFITEWIAVELTAILVAVSLVLFGIITPDKAFSGFASPAVIAIGSLLVVGNGLVKTGVVNWFVDRLKNLTKGRYNRLLFAGTFFPGILSGFINIIATATLFIPAVYRMSLQAERKPSRFLMPMICCAMVGANLSLIGASHNLVVNGLIERAGHTGYSMFEFSIMGLALLGATMLYSFLFGGFLLPGHEPSSTNTKHLESSELLRKYGVTDDLWELEVVDKDHMDAGEFRKRLVEENNEPRLIMHLHGDTQLVPGERMVEPDNGDVFVFEGMKSKTLQLTIEHSGLRFMGPVEAEDSCNWHAVHLAEMVIPPRSSYMGKTLSETTFQRKTAFAVIALWRDNEPLLEGFEDIPLRAGDGLLILGGLKTAAEAEPEPDLLWVEKPHRPDTEEVTLRKTLPAVLIFMFVVVTASFNILSIAVAALLGAAFTVISGVLSPAEAYDSVDWRTIILIACMYPMGEAMQQSGADRTLSQLLLSIPGGSTALGALLLIAVLTMMLTQVIHNAVAAVIVTPLALYAAQQTGADPKGFGIAVIVAASANFLLPVGHPAPLMIREPGKYATSDYLKFGAGLMLLTVSAIGLLVPLIWF